MLKKSLILLSLITSYAQAETCPTPAALKDGHFYQWIAVNIDSGSPIPPAVVKKFRKTVTQFTMAEWMPYAPEGSGHCYYVSNAPVFLAKPKLRADQTNSVWEVASGDTMQCSAGTEQCQFQGTT